MKSKYGIIAIAGIFAIAIMIAGCGGSSPTGDMDSGTNSDSSPGTGDTGVKDTSSSDTSPQDTDSHSNTGDTGDTTSETNGTDTGSEPAVETNCTNNLDDDGDNAIDCADQDCLAEAACISGQEDCDNGLDDDSDLAVDCVDADCKSTPACAEDCGNGVDDNGDTLVDCDDPYCKGADPRCGEVCGDGIDNDDDSDVDCDDQDCADVNPPCGQGTDTDTDTDNPGMLMCDYGGTEPHPCQCDDGIDNDSDTDVDGDDLHCFGPFDDDEGSYATGIPGDNNGSQGDRECPFDGNSGVGNDDICCNPVDPTNNVTPNGCDDQGCCEIDVNGNTTGEHVYIGDTCVYAPSCGGSGTHGCVCTGDTDCDLGQNCVMDKNQGPGFCSTCSPCVSHVECANPCTCGETCFGGFVRPPEECGATDSDTSDSDTELGCDPGQTACPGGDIDCDAGANERCIGGCCYPECPGELQPCETSADCPDASYFCATGCCVLRPT